MADFLEQAILAHLAWKGKLKTAISEKKWPDVNVVGKDDQCDLGKWLHGEGKSAHRSLDEYDTLLKRHSDFHLSVAAVIRMAQSGKTSEADADIMRGEFSRKSAAVISALEALKKKKAA